MSWDVVNITNSVVAAVTSWRRNWWLDFSAATVLCLYIWWLQL